MPTIAQIAKAALDAAGSAITDAVHVATLTSVTNGAYNYATGAYAETETVATGRAVSDSVKPIGDVFPDYTAGPNDTLFLLEGFTVKPVEGWKLTVNGTDRDIRAVQDIAEAGTLFYVVAR